MDELPLYSLGWSIAVASPQEPYGGIVDGLRYLRGQFPHLPGTGTPFHGQRGQRGVEGRVRGVTRGAPRQLCRHVGRPLLDLTRTSASYGVRQYDLIRAVCALKVRGGQHRRRPLRQMAEAIMQCDDQQESEVFPVFTSPARGPAATMLAAQAAASAAEKRSTGSATGPKKKRKVRQCCGSAANFQTVLASARRPRGARR